MASLMHRMPARDATHNENREATELIQLEQNTRVQSRSNLDSRPSRLSNSNSQQQFLWRSVKIFWKSHVAVVVSHDSCRDHFGMSGKCFLPGCLTAWMPECLNIRCVSMIIFGNEKKTCSSIGFLLFTWSALILINVFERPPIFCDSFSIISWISCLCFLSLITIFLALERTFLGYLRTSLALATLGVVVAQLSRLQNSNPAIRSYLLGIPFAATLVAAAILVLVLGAVRFWRQQNAMLRGKVHSGGWEIITVMLTVFIVWSVYPGQRSIVDFFRFPFCSLDLSLPSTWSKTKGSNKPLAHTEF